METHNQKRSDYISWDEYFMGVAMLSGMRSKDPNSQVGACIVSQDNKILSMGYNGFPIGCSDDEFPWIREGNPLDTKYLYCQKHDTRCENEQEPFHNSEYMCLRNKSAYFFSEDKTYKKNKITYKQQDHLHPADFLKHC